VKWFGGRARPEEGPAAPHHVHLTKPPWATSSRMSGGVLKGSTPQERAQKGIDQRDRERVQALRKRASTAGYAAYWAARNAARALDTANRAQLRADTAGASEEQQIKLEAAVDSTRRAHGRCDDASRRARSAAKRATALTGGRLLGAVHEAEAHKEVAARALHETKAAAAAAVKHAR